jgi:hypothetical protein
VAVEKAREEATQAKEEAAKAKEGKKVVEGDVILLTEWIKALEADLVTAKESYSEVKTLAMDYVCFPRGGEEGKG